MNNTNIAWTDFTWNPITGCSAISLGCENCYAKSVHEPFNDTAFTQLTFHENRLSEPLKRKKECKIFIGSMSDIFHEDVSDEWLDAIFHIILRSPHLTFQILTKRAKKMKSYIRTLHNNGVERLVTSKFLEPCQQQELEASAKKFIFGDETQKPFANVWFGVTAETESQANKRVLSLLETKVTHRFLSIEPLLSSIDLEKLEPACNAMWELNSFNGFYNQDDGAATFGYEQLPKIDWVIVGGESGAKSKAREMKGEWVEKIYEQSKKYKTPFFFKQWGAHKPTQSYSFESVQEFLGERE